MAGGVRSLAVLFASKALWSRVCARVCRFEAVVDVELKEPEPTPNHFKRMRARLKATAKPDTATSSTQAEA